ncbi:helix-turn-helix domain-containing protein [Streptomyces griseus]|uniref:helix-turn-helix domain-containing protein n=1 Tax=Streptomyces griseus TaxID=1911 RepID=UPI000A3611D5|nr:helix-turn-helix domain-containing protein [Streptomyces fimicarius]
MSAVKSRVRLKGAEREEMAAALVKGYANASARQLAVRHGLSLGLTQTLLREGGAEIRPKGTNQVPGHRWPPPVPHRKPNPMTEGRLDLVLDVSERYEKGATIRDLVASHGLAYGTVQRLLRAGGVQMRPRNSPQSLNACY